MRNLISTLCLLLLATIGLQAQKYMDIEGDGSLTGNLGVGVNTPLERLHLDGGILLGNTTNANNGTIRFNGTDIEAYVGGAWASLTGGGGASPWTVGGSNLFYSTGNVFIGNTSNQSILQVDGGVNFTVSDTRQFYMPVWVPGINKQVFAGVFTGQDTYAPLLRFYAPAGEYTDIGVDTLGNFEVNTIGATRLTVKYGNGYTGIGTTAPTTRLHVENNVAGQRVIQGIYNGAASDVAAVYGENDDTDYYGYGVHGKGGYIGVYGNVTPTGSSAYRGVVGQVSGGSGENVGLWGSASGSGRNYAVYASGDIKVSSQLFIGTSTTQEDAAAGYELVVDGEAIVEELVVELSSNWPDYVFKADYDLKSLSEVKAFIDENGHLPEIPSAAEMEAADGVAVGEMQRILLQKVEELTLYMIELEAKNKVLEQQIESLQNK